MKQLIISLFLLCFAFGTSAQENLEFTVKGVSFTMVYVQGGTFTMGCTPEQGGDCFDDETPVHTVTLSSYYIGETEVTQELWYAVMGDNPSYFKFKSGSLKRPVEQVSWEDCYRFIRKLNELTGKKFLLPTEAQWEFAARGGTKSAGYKYSGSNDLNSVAWYSENAGGKNSPDYGTHVVKTKKPNELGIYDMSGNVLEWCYDWYGDYTSVTQTPPLGAPSGSYRVNRGGSWCDLARYSRSSCRSLSGPGARQCYFGLRLVLHH